MAPETPQPVPETQSQGAEPTSPARAEVSGWAKARRRMFYALLGSGLAFAAFDPKDAETLLLTNQGIHEGYEYATLSSQEQLLADRIKKELPGRIGNFALTRIETSESVSSPEERIKKLAEGVPPTHVSGFEQQGMSNEFVQHVLDETLPKGVRMNIASVSYDRSWWHGMRSGITKHLRGIPDKTVGAVADPDDHDIAVLVPMLPSPNGSGAENRLFGFLTHEQGHVTDWQSNKLLTRVEKFELFLSILERLNSPDRFQALQFAGLKGDTVISKYMLALEYFAEVSKYYLIKTTPGGHSGLAPADQAIMKAFVQKMDPSFDVVRANVRRIELIAQVEDNQKLLDVVERWKSELGEK